MLPVNRKAQMTRGHSKVFEKSNSWIDVSMNAPHFGHFMPNFYSLECSSTLPITYFDSIFILNALPKCNLSYQGDIFAIDRSF